ncbi:MAG: SDR family NAD(P)-dependent oxidoreductase [Actinoplanes sp.]
MSKTVVVFGAGTGLGAAVARRFGREGYRVALVARNRDRLAALAAALAGEGVEAAVFPADLSRTDEVPALIGRIRERFGRIDVIEYAPITTDLFTPATELDAASEQHYLNLHLLTPIEIVRAVLPEMLERGDGGILIGQGATAVEPAPFRSGLGPAMAAARNYIQSLHGEVADRGVYAATLHIGAMIVGSAGHEAITSGQVKISIDPALIPTIEPADLADLMWTMLTKRDRSDDLVPAA